MFDHLFSEDKLTPLNSMKKLRKTYQLKNLEKYLKFILNWKLQ